MNVTKQFKDYFIPLAKTVPGINYAVLSDGDRMERFLADSRSEDVYPGVFCLRPKCRLSDNGADQTLGWFEVTFYVFCYCSGLGDYADEDATYDEAERLATEIYKKLRAEDGERILFEDGRALMLEPVSWLVTDACYGYEAKVRFALPINPIIYS